jgi:DNA-binding NarL/FixJ family response regulator
MLNECLVKEDYTVLVAMDGAQVLAIVNRIVPDIVLLDAMMPNIDGFETCKELKKNSELNEIPVIFMTGLSDSEHVLMGLEAGGVDYINKPVNLDELLARIRVHLSNSRKAKGARNALDEIGQFAFASDIHGQMLWSTVGARKMFETSFSTNAKNTVSIHNVDEFLQAKLKQWLQHRPDKNSVLTLPELHTPLQIRYVGQTSPGEYLFKLSQDSEIQVRNILRESYGLTEREAEVLFWLSKGKTNREIAQILSISPRTVNKHLETVYKKLGVENRTSAAAVCSQYVNAG